MSEEWRDIEGYEGLYRISNMGRIISFVRKEPKIMSTQPSHGYATVALFKNGSGKSYAVHCLVARAFIGERPDGCEVHHIDHNKSNNRLDNLAYVTPSENIRAAIPYRIAAEKERRHRRQQEHYEFLEQIEQAKEVGILPFPLAERRLHGLCFNDIRGITEVAGISNVFDVTFSRPLSEDQVLHLMSYDFYAYPEDLLSNDYRIIWCPDGD